MNRMEIEVHGRDGQLFSHFIEEDGTTWVVDDKQKVAKVCVLTNGEVTTAQLSAIASLVVHETADNATLRVKYDDHLMGLADQNPAMKRLMVGSISIPAR